MNRPKRFRVEWLLAGAALVWTAGCAHGPVPEPKDPAKGEYYTSDEVRRLPADELDRYCSWMEQTLFQSKAEAVRQRAKLDSLKVEGDSLRNREVRLSKETSDTSARLRELRLREKASNTYVVNAGDNLRKIARTVFGDGTRWKELYDANKDLIGKEDAELKPGTRLTIPRLAEQAR